MRWEEKMQAVVWDVLGEEYDVLRDGNKITIYNNGHLFITSESIHDLNSHWQYELEKVILIMIKNKISEAYKKIQ